MPLFFQDTPLADLDKPPLLSRLKQTLLARKTVLLLLILLMSSLFLGSTLPQRFNTPDLTLARWQQANPVLGRFAAVLGLDHIYTTPWFAVLLALFLSSLLLSTIEQSRLALRRTWGPPPPAQHLPLASSRPFEKVLAAAQQAGFRLVSRVDHTCRLVRNAAGYWGAALFHLGLLLVLAGVLLLVLTQKRGLVHLAEGEVFSPGMAWTSQEKGVLADFFFLPEAVRLESVRPEFWETDDLKQQRATVTFLEPGTESTTCELEINRTVFHRNIRVDQSASFGHAFLVILVDEAGRELPLRMDLEHPSRRDQASYNSFEFESVPYLVKAKYYADASHRSIDSGTPQLVLRLDLAGESAGEISLLPGQQGSLGPYTARLIGTARWTGLVFSDLQGMGLVFFGFFVIIGGGVLIYCLPPREIVLQAAGTGCRLAWKAGRFAAFYESELQGILEDEQPGPG